MLIYDKGARNIQHTYNTKALKIFSINGIGKLDSHMPKKETTTTLHHIQKIKTD